MVLNNNPQMFTVFFPSNFFYEAVCKKWDPIINRMNLPYQTTCDFMNKQIQAIRFPSVNFEMSDQQRGQYEVMYPGGKELEPLIDKNLQITFKLSESYISYWILWDQVDIYLHYGDRVNPREPIWMEPVHLAFLNDAGFQLMEFHFREIVPTNMSEINLSYAATAASYNTFTWTLHYNVFDIL